MKPKTYYAVWDKQDREWVHDPPMLHAKRKYAEPYALMAAAYREVRAVHLVPVKPKKKRKEK